MTSRNRQSSDWAARQFERGQLAYAASDVLHLHALRDKLYAMLARENRTELAAACFEFLPTRASSISPAGRISDIFSDE